MPDQYAKIHVVFHEKLKHITKKTPGNDGESEEKYAWVCPFIQINVYVVHYVLNLIITMQKKVLGINYNYYIPSKCIVCHFRQQHLLLNCKIFCLCYITFLFLHASPPGSFPLHAPVSLPGSQSPCTSPIL